MTKDKEIAKETKVDNSCSVCGHNKPFLMPREVIEAAKQGNLVIFAGAGVSTEVPAVFPQNIYQDILAQLTDKPASTEFPDVMSSYQGEFGRTKLIQAFWNKFDYIRSFASLRNPATKFHFELATMPYIHEVVTTNWDTYFEEVCGAIPIVSGDDYALHSIQGRKVYKIHGSMNSIASIVATREDYNSCLERLSSSALGGTLKHILATKTVVFIGYSLADSDFASVFKALISDMGAAQPRYYGVSPFVSKEADELGVKQILTDGTFFLHKLKDLMIEESCYLKDEIYDRTYDFLDSTREARESISSISHVEFPGVLYGHCYLDGINDACDKIQANRCRGEYSDAHSMVHKLAEYDRLYDVAIDRDRYYDAAYIEGYVTVLYYLVAEDTRVPSAYFCFSSKEIDTIDKFRSSVRNLRRRNLKAWTAAKKISDSYGPGLIAVHTPFLAGLG